MKESLLTAGRIVVGLLIVALSYGQEQPLTVFGTAEGLSDNQVADVHRDKLGYLWISTAHGLNLYNGIDFQVFRNNPEDSTSIRDNSLEFLYEDHQANIWVALTMGGVNKYNRAKGRFEYFTHNPSNGDDPNNFVTDVLVDSQKRTWIGTSTHMNLLDSLTGRYQPVTIEGQQELQVYKIFEDARHHIWIGTSKGLFQKSPQQTYFTEVLNSKGEKMEEIFRFVEDREDQLWLSSYYHVYQLQGEVPIEVKTPHERFITSLFSTKKGNVLISQYEDHIYEWDGNAWKMIQTDFTTTDQLRYAFADEEMSRIMIEDNEGNLAIYDEETGKTRSIAQLTDDFNSFWFGAEADELWIGTLSSGLLQLDIRTPSFNQQNRMVLIEALHIHTDSSSFYYPSNLLSEDLTRQQNFVSFDFIQLDYHTAQKVVYQYRLLGLEKQWHTSSSRQAHYAHLPSGEYTFEVKASTDGQWSQDVSSLTFTIATHFWLLPWFQALVVFFVCLLLYSFYRFRLNMKRSKARALENSRQNAAADFHDELGNKLTRIALFSEVLEQKLQGTSPEISSYVSKIKDNSHVLNNSMRDFLWALDPAKDTAFDLIILLKDFGDELFDNSGLHFHGASIKAILREYPLDMDWKRNLVMIFKEAMHNALKYSMANNVTLKASLSKDVLNLSLTDDGEGFDPLEIDNGYSQANMKRRAEYLEASVSIESKRNSGTVVTFIGSLTKKQETYD